MANYRPSVELCLLSFVACSLNACAVGEISGPLPQADDGPPRGAEDGNARYNGAPPVLQCTGANPDVAARSGWKSGEASVPADGVLRLELKARPTAANLDGLVAVGAESIDDFDKAAIAVRFAENGLVDVRDGASYASDMAYPYEPGVWYSIGILANIENQTYDVEIGPCGETSETLIKRASFRDSAVVPWLRAWAVWSSQSAALEVSTPAWMPSGSCVPATCESLGHECGQPSDGCGGTSECGGCGNAELCNSGLCVEELVTTPPSPTCIPDTCESLGLECGVRSDGCGDYVACGDCPDGSSCSSGACVQDSACEPDTCESLLRECGVASDGCGGTLNCGACGSGETCANWGGCVAAASPSMHGRGPTGQWPPGFPAYTTAAELTTDGTNSGLMSAINDAACSDGCVIEHAGNISERYINSRAGTGEIVVRPPIGQRADFAVTALIEVSIPNVVIAGYANDGQMVIQSTYNSGFAWVEDEGTDGLGPDCKCAANIGRDCTCHFYEIVYKDFGGSGMLDRIRVGNSSTGSSIVADYYGSHLFGGTRADGHSDTLQTVTKNGSIIVNVHGSYLWPSWEKVIQGDGGSDWYLYNVWIANTQHSNQYWAQQQGAGSWWGGVALIEDSTVLGNNYDGQTPHRNCEIMGTTSFVDLGGNTILSTLPVPPAVPTHTELDAIWSP